jgi:hypothetical protein
LDRPNQFGRGVISLRLLFSLCSRKSGKALEESLVLCPPEQQDWFSNRNLFDLIVIYDEDSRVNSYAGGPVMDRKQVRLRNLTVSIFDYAYLKPLKHVPMLLVGGIRAWCSLVREAPLKDVEWEQEADARFSNPQRPKEAQPPSPGMRSVQNRLVDLDLNAESQSLESLHSNEYL